MGFFGIGDKHRKRRTTKQKTWGFKYKVRKSSSGGHAGSSRDRWGALDDAISVPLTRAVYPISKNPRRRLPPRNKKTGRFVKGRR
jgi:hypothetical protein